MKTVHVRLPEYGPSEIVSSEFDEDGNLQIKMIRRQIGWLECELPQWAIDEALERNDTDDIVEAYVKEVKRVNQTLSGMTTRAFLKKWGQ